MSLKVDLELFQREAHNPSFRSIRQHLTPEEADSMVDYCIPVNPYFPTPEILHDIRSSLEDILKYYPDENQSIADILGETLGLSPQSIVMSNGSTEAITWICLLYTSPSPRDQRGSRMPSSA